MNTDTSHLQQALRDIIGMCRTSDPTILGIKQIAEDALPIEKDPLPTTASGFLTNYPDSKRNSGKLVNMGCPNCGNRQEFEIRSEADLTITDDGPRDCTGATWEYTSQCICPKCNYGGGAGRFYFVNLETFIDEAIRQRSEQC